MKKNMIAVIIAASMLAAVVTGYFAHRKMMDGEVNAAELEEYEASEEAALKNYYVVGISQFSEDDNMDICREAFVKELEQYGLVEGDNLSIRYLNADSNESKASQISDSFVADGVDLIYAIEEKSANSAYRSALGTKVPVIYSSLKDPLKDDGEEIDEAFNPYKGNITGIIEKIDVESEIAMIRKTLPKLNKLGIIYDSENDSLLPALEEYKKVAAKYGMLLYVSAVEEDSNLAEATSELASKAECICVLNDDLITENLTTVLETASKSKVPVFGSTKEQAEDGCSGAVSIDYEKLGQTCADLAAQILMGETDITELSTTEFTDSNTYNQITNY
ncbi:MAG: hypothetical protein E7302_01695 [Butyrivibrio sp.]|nr:hypothetical protein [Butyrivibrio sp.]